MTVASEGQTSTAHLLVPTLGSVHQRRPSVCVCLVWVSVRLEQFEGDLLVTVQRRAEGTFVEAATKIKGQLFDWGKSAQLLDQLFADLTMTPVAV